MRKAFLSRYGLLPMLAVTLLMLGSQVASAATIDVNSAGDVVDPNDAQCTFREAYLASEQDTDVNVNPLADANECLGVGSFGADTIQLNKPVTYDVASSLLGDYVVNGDLTIAGTDQVNTVLDGGNMYIRFTVNPNGVLHMSGVTLAHFHSPNHGGALYNDVGGTLHLVNVILSQNQADAAGGAILNKGTMSLDTVVIDNNRSAQSGGGIYNDGMVPYIVNSTIRDNVADDGDSNTVEFGGGVSNSTVNGSITLIDNTTFTGNLATYGGGLYNRAISPLTVTNSTFDNNTAKDVGLGGGIYNGYGDLLVRNSTISNNHAQQGAGVMNWNTSSFNGTVYTAVFENTTFSGNVATVGGGAFHNLGDLTLRHVTAVQNSDGVFNQDTGAVVTLNMVNTILADNMAADCTSFSNAFAVGSMGSNLVGATVGCTGWVQNGAAGDDILAFLNSGVDPVLASNGGSTMTHALLAGSPAVDAADLAQCLVNDQRGYVRTAQGGPACDIGAFERDITPPTLMQVTPVPTYTNDNSPSYVFFTSEDGVLALSPQCLNSIPSNGSNVLMGNVTLDFNMAADGLYQGCAITVTDSSGNVSSTLVVPDFTIDTVAPVVTEIAAVSTPGTDATPDYTFSASEDGSVGFTGGCYSTVIFANGSPAPYTLTLDNVNLNAQGLADGTYNCVLSITDLAGNAGMLNMSSFTVDTTGPVLTETTPVPAFGNNNSPDVTIQSNEDAQLVSFTGSCEITMPLPLNLTGGVDLTIQSMMLNPAGTPFPDGTYSDCTFGFVDSLGNTSQHTLTAFTIDTVVPVLAEVTPVPAQTNDNTPDYTFSSTEIGVIVFGGVCSGPMATNSVVGNNTVTLSQLADGTYTNCTILVKDAAQNVSAQLPMTAFTVETVAPVVTETTPVPTPSTNQTPAYTFDTDEAGTITYGGACTSSTVAAVVGHNAVTFNTLAPATYSTCTITVTDVFGNVSNVLTVTPFTIDPVVVAPPVGGGGGGGGGSGGQPPQSLLQSLVGGGGGNVGPNGQPVGGGAGDLDAFGNPIVPFTDISDSPLKDQIEDLQKNCGVQGYKDLSGKLLGLYKPQNSITRAELITILVKCKVGALPTVTKVSFTDVASDHWSAAYVEYAFQNKIVEGFGDKTFRPNADVTREQALKMILGVFVAADLIDGSPVSTLCKDLSGWSVKYWNYALNNTILGGYNDADGKPTGYCGIMDEMTRGQAAKVIVNARPKVVAN